MKSSDIFGKIFLVLALNITRTLSADLVEVYEGFTYTFVRTSRTFNDSEADCVSRGGHLASVHSEKELNFIQGVFTNNSLEDMWIGLYTNLIGPNEPGKLVIRSMWSWTDGSGMDYIGGWAPDEPNGGEDCARHRRVPDNNWSGAPEDGCTNKYYYICKSVRGVIPSTTSPKSDGTPTSGPGGENSSSTVCAEERERDLALPIAFGVIFAVLLVTNVITFVLLLRERAKNMELHTPEPAYMDLKESDRPSSTTPTDYTTISAHAQSYANSMLPTEAEYHQPEELNTAGSDYEQVVTDQ